MGKKLIITSNLSGKHGARFIEKADTMVKGVVDNSTIVPAIDPATTVVEAKLVAMGALIASRTTHENTAKEITVQILAMEADIDNDITSQWVGQVQKAVKGDLAKVKLLGFGAKGIYTGKTPAKAIVGNAYDSFPAIIEIDFKVHLRHIVLTRNSANGKKATPKDARSLEIYMQIGGLTPPTETSKMSHLGSATRGNIVHTFDEADLGKIVYYIAVYIDRKTKKQLILSPVMSATIN